MNDNIEEHVLELVNIAETEGFIAKRGSGNFDKHGRNKNARAIGEVISMAANRGVIHDIYGNRIDSPTILSVVITEVEKRTGRYGELKSAWEDLGGL